MTAVIYRWQIFCSIAFCFFLTGFATASSSVNDSLYRLRSHEFDHRIDVLESFFPGQNVCSLAGSLKDPPPIESSSTPSSVQSAPTAAVPVDIAVDQFSLLRFGQIGFTPQCLFVDDSAPQGYLETKIADTLKPTRNPIYDTSDFNWVVEAEEADPYWEYYSDCDAWNVVFSKLPERSKSGASQWFSASMENLKQFSGTAWNELEHMISTSKQMEFEKVELEGIEFSHPVSIPVQETLINGMRELRPVIRGVIDHDLVRNPYGWLQSQQNRIGNHLDGTSLAIVWTSLTQVQWLGRVGVKPRNGINRRNGIWKDNFSWIAKKLEQVVGTIKIR